MVHLDAAGGGGCRTEVFVADQIRLSQPAGEYRDALAHHLAGVIAEHAPVHDAFDRRRDLDQVRAVAMLGAMEAPVGDLAGEHRCAGALAAFGVGTGTDHRIAVDDRRGFHPRAVVATLRHVAGEVGCAGLEYAHAALGDEGLAAAGQTEGLGAGAERLPVLRVVAALQVTGRRRHRRHVEHFVTVEVEQREDGLIAAALLAIVVLQERVGGAGHAGDIRDVDEAIGAERLGVAHQQFHRLLARTAGLAVEHGAFLVGQLHGGLPPGAVAVWRAPVSQGLRPWCRGLS